MAEPFFALRQKSGNIERTKDGFLAVRRPAFPSGWYFACDVVGENGVYPAGPQKPAFALTISANGKTATRAGRPEYPQYDFLAHFSSIDWAFATQSVTVCIRGTCYAPGANVDVWAFGKYYDRITLNYPAIGWGEFNSLVWAETELLKVRMERDTNAVYINGKFWGNFPEIQN